MLEVSVGKKTRIEYLLEDNLPTLDGDAAQLGQIVMNLVINAAEAIGANGGLVAIRTGTVWCDSHMFESMWLQEVLQEGRYVFVEVSDTGCGMDRQTLDRIFDPFFTTKFTGRGLGLAAVLGIVRGHRGAIAVCSHPGEGTTFRVLFPSGHLTSVPRALPGQAEGALDAHGLILLVDDEETVRMLGRRVLERIGFEVITAQDGLEAVELFRAHRDRVRLVLLDLMMPRLDGQEALTALRAIDPDVKVILCSGYNAEDVTPRFEEARISGFLQKPYDVAALSDAIRHALHVPVTLQPPAG